jgi:hypothetical protein
MTLCDLTGQGHSQLLVGAEDQEMRVYVDGGELLHEFTETEVCERHLRVTVSRPLA